MGRRQDDSSNLGDSNMGLKKETEKLTGNELVPLGTQVPICRRPDSKYWPISSQQNVVVLFAILKLLLFFINSSTWIEGTHLSCYNIFLQSANTLSKKEVRNFVYLSLPLFSVIIYAGNIISRHNRAMVC